MQILAVRTFRHLFFAQVIALLGTGLATIALALLAFEIAGDNAGRVLGTALAIKMVAYICVAPVASAILSSLPRKTVLVMLDLWRGSIVFFLPFVSDVWQIYVLIFLLQSGSAAFTPMFQATIPDILTDEHDYTRALSLSRVAYDLESLLSPLLAGLLLTFVSFSDLFGMTAFGFLLSAAFIYSVALPGAPESKKRGFADRLTRGIRIYLATPRLRGLLAINAAISSVGAIVLINTVVYVQSQFALGETQTAFAFAAFGGGSMVAALLIPRLLSRFTDRSVMIPSAFLLGSLAILLVFVTHYAELLILWFGIGFVYSMTIVPSGRLLRRSAHPDDRPELYTAQFVLSHSCWLVAYPIAGWGGLVFGLAPTAIMLAFVAVFASILALWAWPGGGQRDFEHSHTDLPPDHPHLLQGNQQGNGKHSHAYIIDDLHPRWPS